MTRARLLILWQLVVFCFSMSMAQALDVGDIRCTRGSSNTQCRIELHGTVSSDDVLLIKEISDADIAISNNIELGRTGYLFGKPFYAQFFPRMYSLAPLVSRLSPIVIIHCVGLVSKEAGISPQVGVVSVIKNSDSFKTYLFLIGPHIATVFLLLFAAAISIGAMREGVVDGWRWPHMPFCILFICAFAFNLSMTRIPRILVPRFLTWETYYYLHAIIEAGAIWALAELGRSAFWSDITAVQCDLHLDGLFSIAARWLNFLIFVFAIIVLSTASADGFKDRHALVVALQTFIFGLSLAQALAKVSFIPTLRRALPGALVFLFSQVMAFVVLVRDSVTYLWWHGPGTSYYMHFSLASVIVAGAYRAHEMRILERRGKTFFEETRVQLAFLQSGQTRLSRLCSIIQQKWVADRVNITSIRDGMILMLASEGPGAKMINGVAAPIGRLLAVAIARKGPIYVPGENGFSVELKANGFKNACFLIPVLQDGEVVAAITVMLPPGRTLSPTQAQVLRMSASSLSLEVVSALSQALVESQLAQISQIAKSTSGVVLECTDSWGNLRAATDSSRRIILSIDRIKSTYIDQIGYTSPIIWAMYLAYKREVYAYWMALKDVFELLSKDVRGDDFWVLTPKGFKNPVLQNLGQEKVGLVAAFLMDAVCIEISKRPEFLPLQRAGAHVAVSADESNVIPLGTAQSICFDVHARKMSRIHRIRSEADPGGVLVDMDDAQLSEALKDASLFMMGQSRMNVDEHAFADLQRLPTVAILVDVRLSPELLELRDLAFKNASESPYRDRMAAIQAA